MQMSHEKGRRAHASIVLGVCSARGVLSAPWWYFTTAPFLSRTPTSLSPRQVGGTLIKEFRGEGEVNWLTFGMAAGMIAILLLGRRINRRFPTPLLLLILTTIASYLLDFEGKGVKVVGEVDASFPTPRCVVDCVPSPEFGIAGRRGIP